MAAPMSRVVSRVSTARICRNFRQIEAINWPKKLNNSWTSRPCFSALRLDPKRHFSAKEERLCWLCQNEISAEILLCGNCGIVQNVDKNANYFKLFRVEQRFVVSAAEISRKFKALQGLLHPDKFAGKSQREQEYSSECSSFLNAAYETLLRPLDRGEYLLRLKGQEVAETGMEMDREFLMDIMETNELLAEPRLSEQQLRKMNEENEARTKDALVKLTEAFEDDRLDEAKTLLSKLKYFVNIEKKIEALEIEFGIVR